MNGNEKKNYSLLSLPKAQQTILAATSPLADEIVGLHEARQRVTSSDVLAVIAQPSYDESTRDGFVIRVIDGSSQKTISTRS